MVRDRLPLNPRAHWLITGAGRGIGEALAREVRGKYPVAHLSLADRDLPSAQRLAAELGHATALRTELAQIGELELTLGEARAASGPVDVLVNNAGVMWVGDAASFTRQRTEELLAVDLVAPIRLVQLVLPEMRSRGGGSI
ncbi:MAG: SDR family NAD(P)-dependent oxidoreductase, partial [Myxococcales bacterium]|nr:SDR family NAD(P)-dependent oxidoreductase [Myxococcales bacterium]